MSTADPAAAGLTGKRCTPCEEGGEPMSAEQARGYLKHLHSDWQLVDDDKRITREFSFKNFYHTMSFVNAVAHIANQENHHPDLEVGYNRCRVSYQTHAVGGLSENDLICAAKVDQLVE